MKDEFGRLPKTMGKDLTDLFPRGDHPDKRSSERWLKDLEERKFVVKRIRKIKTTTL